MSMQSDALGTITLSTDLKMIDQQLAAETKRLAKYRVKVPYAKAGPWTIKPVRVREDLETLRQVRIGRGTGPGKYTLLQHATHGIVMSDTNAEIKDFLRYIYKFHGNVLVTGLGIGCVVKALLTRDVIGHITVVEQSADLIRLVAPSYKNSRVTIVEGDAYEWTPPLGTKYDWAWHDIWYSIGPSKPPQMARMRRHYKSYMVGKGRQECWGEDECQRLTKEGVFR